MAKFWVWSDQEQERVQARGMNVRRQFNQYILDHMTMPERPS